MTKILCFLMLGLFSLQLSASKLNFNIMTPAPTHRSGAPIPIIVQSFFDGAFPLTGILEIKIFSGPQVLATIQTDEITIVPGTQVRDMFLPAVEDMDYSPRTFLDIAFITPTKRYSMRRQEILSLYNSERTFTILTGYSDFQRKNKFNFAKELKFENLADKKDTRERIGYSGVVKLKLDNFPKSVEGYCAYNIVLLNDEIFSDMDSTELSVLKEWVFAGGALFIDVRNSTLKFHHLKFLNDLITADSSKNPKLLLKPSGKLMLSEKSEYYHYNPEFGRLILFTRKLDSAEYFKTSNWRSLLAFLWCVNRNRLKCIIHNRSWTYSKEEESYQELYQNNFQRYRNGYYESYSLNEIFHAYITLFLPKKSEMIPIWLLILLLGSFMLCVGPVDYIILGKLKKHNLTWILFPLISIMYALIIIKLADYYMGTSDYISNLEIMDEGSNKKVLRTVKYEIVFTGTSKAVIRDCKKEFYSRQNSFSYGSNRTSDNMQYKYCGMLFSNYHTEFNTTQWRPKINRINSFYAVKNNHPAWTFPDKWSSSAQVDFLKQRFTSNEEFLDISILNNGNITTLRTSQNRLFEEFISDLKKCMNRYTEYGSITPYISSVSPTPEYGEEHLVIGDSTDKECKVVIVSIYNAASRKVRIYRRVYRKKLPLNQYAVTDSSKKIECSNNQQD